MRLVHRVRLDAGGDPRALGGAITVELCGHWEHDGDCRWPHHTSVHERAGAHVVDVEVTCAPEHEDEVRRRVRAALASGALTGPDGRRTTWSLA